MADKTDTPRGKAPSKNDPLVPQHKRAAMGADVAKSQDRKPRD